MTRIASPRWIAATLAVVVSLISASALHSAPIAQDDDELRELAQQIRRSVLALDQLRSAETAAAAAHAENTGRLRRQIERLEGSITQSRDAADQASAARSAEEADARRRSAALPRLREIADSWVQPANGAIRKALVRVESATGWRRAERLGALQDILTQLGSSEQLEQIDATTSLLQYFADELTAARSIHLANEPILLDAGQRLVDAWRLRFGLVFEAYVAESSDETGVGSFGADPDWTTPSASTPWEKSVGILRELAPPTLVQVPLPTAVSPLR